MPIKKTEEKRQRILEAAIQLFSENGYTKTTIKDIANAAGVSFGTVFTYFENKETLYQSAILEPLDDLRNEMLDIPEPGPQPLEDIKKVISRHFELFAEQKVYLRMIQYVIGQPERFNDIFLKLDRVSLDLRGALKPLIAVGQEKGDLIDLDPDLISDSYLAYINGVRLTITDPPENRERWEQFARQAMLLFGPTKL